MKMYNVEGTRIHVTSKFFCKNTCAVRTPCPSLLILTYTGNECVYWMCVLLNYSIIRVMHAMRCEHAVNIYVYIYKWDNRYTGYSIINICKFFWGTFRNCKAYRETGGSIDSKTLNYWQISVKLRASTDIAQILWLMWRIPSHWILMVAFKGLVTKVWDIK